MAERLIPSPRRRLALAGLAVGVSLVHLWATQELVADRFGSGAGQRLVKRIEVAFVRELAPAAPAAAEVAPARPVRRSARAAPTPKPAASAPEPVAQQPIEKPAEPAPELAPPPEMAAEPEPAASAEAAPAMAAVARPAEPSEPAAPVAAAAPAAEQAASAAAAAAAFEWPPSTRLTYVLNGNYRGEVQGKATVEWIRVGLRYQVHLEALVGPSFAPLLARRISSEGLLTEAGLAPRQFDGEQRVGFRTRRWSIRFEPERIVLADSKVVEMSPGAQDEASQFVQLTWLFTTQPAQLQPGKSVEFPLALTRRVDRWVYDVIGEELLQLPFGTIPSIHLKPRREGRPGDLNAQMWIAPTLQYLPVRILIHQDAQTFVDLMLEQPPMQSMQR